MAIFAVGVWLFGTFCLIMTMATTSPVSALLFLAGELVGKEIKTAAGNCFTVKDRFSRLGVEHVTATSDGKPPWKPKLSEAVVAYLRALVAFKDGKPVLSNPLTVVLARVVQRNADFRARRAAAKKAQVGAAKKAKRALRVFDELDKNKAQELAADLKHAGTQRTAAAARLAEAGVVLTSTDGERSSYMNNSELQSFCLETLKVGISERTLKRYVAAAPAVEGRPTAFLPEVERAIVEALLYSDKMGTPVTMADALELVSRMAADNPKLLERGGKDGFGEAWYKAFVQRAKQWCPDLVTVLQRGKDAGTTDWYNTDNIEWYYAAVLRILDLHNLVDYLVRPEGSKLSGHRFEFKEPQFVLFSDETCVRGKPGAARKTGNGNGKAAVLTQSSRVEKENGRGTRRTPADPESSGHITMIGGCTGDGQIAPAAFVVTGGKLSPARRKPLEDSLPDNFPLINGNKQSKAIISSSPKGGVVSENILEVMQAMFKFVRPDHSKEKPIVWFTDWGPGRMSEELLTWCRENGIIHIGYLPLCTSLMQFPDTHLFGPFKSLQSKLIAAFKRDADGRSLTDAEQITIACRAMMQICTKKRALAGLHAIGMRPFDKAMALTNPAVQDGDVQLEIVNNTVAQLRMRYSQLTAGTPPQTRTIAEAKKKETYGVRSPDEYSLPDICVKSSPEREEKAMSVVNSVIGGKTRLGQFRTFADRVATVDELQQEKSRLSMVSGGLVSMAQAAEPSSRATMKAEHSLQLASSRAKYERSVAAAKFEKNCSDAEANAALERRAEQLGQYSSNLRHLATTVDATNVTEDPKKARNTLALIGEYVSDLSRAKVDFLGLAIDPGEIAMQEQRPNLAMGAEASATVSLGPLQQVIHRADAAVRRRSVGEGDAAANRAAKRQKTSKDGGCKMIIGSMLHASGAVSATDERYVAIVESHEKTKTTTAAKAVGKATAKLAAALPATIAQAASTIYRKCKGGKKVLIGDCACYVSASLKFAKAVGDKPKTKALAKLKLKKGADLVAAVTALVLVKATTEQDNGEEMDTD